jgi:hypothetical protein
VLARHAGIDEDTGQLTGNGGRAAAVGDLQRLLLGVHLGGQEGRRTGEPVLLAHIRRYFVRAGDANPAQLTYWTGAWLERIKDLYTAHEQLMSAWAQTDDGARLHEAREA